MEIAIVIVNLILLFYFTRMGRHGPMWTTKKKLTKKPDKNFIL